MPDEDEGWGGTADEGWTFIGPPVARPVPQPATEIVQLPQQPLVPSPGASPSPPAAPYAAPPYAPPRYGSAPASFAPPPGAPFVPGPGHAPRPGRRTPLLVVGALVVVAAVVVAVVLLTSGGDGSGSSGLLGRAPFSGCQESAKNGYDTTAVTDQIACTGADVQTKVGATGVQYAQFGSPADLDAWYSRTILAANRITPAQGDCTSGTTVNTAAGANYCESAAPSGGAARQLVMLAPANVTVSNGPNNTSGNCPDESFTLLVFTVPADDVGVVALNCASSPQNAQTFESRLTSGAFNLR